MSDKPNNVIVIKAHKASYDKTINAKAGDIVTLDHSKSPDNEWPGWIWGVDKNGLGSWLPINYLDIENDTAKFKCDYSAKELTVEISDKLTVINEESGWYLCKDESGQIGWIPIENVK